jgi:[ribosomal protein S5]-alanine N-acetyltransferase
MRPCSNEPELTDPAVTGQFAEQMAALAKMRQVPPWCGFVSWGDAGPMGFAGFKSAPDAVGDVEIGYLTFPMHEGKGVAKAMAAAMVHLARSSGAKALTAKTLPESNASTGVLAANGFVRDGEGADDDVGTIWRWRRVL